MIGDPTGRPRPQARKTPYVGTLKDGKTPGFWLLLLATPYRGRALPCGFVTYSSKTIAQLARSRNQYHWEASDQVKVLLGDKPLVLGREFSYLDLQQYLIPSRINSVIRLHLGSHPPTFFGANGRKVTLCASLGEEIIYRGLRYMGQVTVNVVGVWHKGHAEPLWLMANLTPEQALIMYAARMKIEEAFCDLKNLLSLNKLMNKSQPQMEQMAALVMLALTIGLLVGETLAMPFSELPTTPKPSPTRRIQPQSRPTVRRAASGSCIPASSSCSIAKSHCRQDACANSSSRSWRLLRNSSNPYLSELKSEAQEFVLTKSSS